METFVLVLGAVLRNVVQFECVWTKLQLKLVYVRKNCTDLCVKWNDRTETTREKCSHTHAQTHKESDQMSSESDRKTKNKIKRTRKNNNTCQHEFCVEYSFCCIFVRSSQHNNYHTWRLNSDLPVPWNQTTNFFIRNVPKMKWVHRN